MASRIKSAALAGMLEVGNGGGGGGLCVFIGLFGLSTSDTSNGDLNKDQ